MTRVQHVAEMKFLPFGRAIHATKVLSQKHQAEDGWFDIGTGRSFIECKACAP